jgi:hypothetical protein
MITEHRNLPMRFATCVDTDDPDLLTQCIVYKVLPPDSHLKLPTYGRVNIPRLFGHCKGDQRKSVVQTIFDSSAVKHVLTEAGVCGVFWKGEKYFFAKGINNRFLL